MKHSYFLPLMMTEKDANVVKEIIFTLKRLDVANGLDIANILGIIYFISVQRQIESMESDYDDSH